jgi:hypothetical protein
MADNVQITGLTGGAADLDFGEVHFVLGARNQRFSCVAPIGVVEQIVAGLARHVR